MSFLKTPFDPRIIPNLALWLDGADLTTISQDPAGSVTAVTAPTDISGCLAWYDANDLSTLKQNTDGTGDVTLDTQKIGYWADKSGNGYHLVATSNARRPELKTKLENNTPVRSVYSDYFIEQTAQDKWLRNASVPATTGQSWFVVHSEFGNTTNGRVCGRTTNAAIFISGQAASPPVGYFATQAGSSNNVNAATNTKTGRFLSSLIFTDTTSASTYGDGLLTATFDPNDLYSTTNGFGVLNDSGGTPGSGKIHEVILFNRAVTDEERRRIEKYLSAKWNVPSADSAYPGTKVGYWGDKSGNGYHATQATASQRPTLINEDGLPSLFFNSSDANWMALPNLSAPFAENSAATVFAVYRNKLSTSHEIFESRNNYSWLHTTSSGVGWSGWFRYNRIAIAGNTLANNTSAQVKRVISCVSNTDTWEMFINGASVYATTPDFYAGDSFRLGLTHSTSYFTGNYLELIIFARTLTTAEQQQVEQYLANKWKIALA